MTSTYLLGLDLGRRRDWTALAVVRRPPASDHYSLIHIDRWRGHSYRHVVPKLREVQQALWQRANAEFLERYHHVPGGGAPLDMHLLVDMTGVGVAVVDDIIRAAGIDCLGVTITAGTTVNREGQDYKVPKKELVGRMEVIVENHRLAMPDSQDLPLVETLVAELDNFRVSTKLSTGHDSFGAGEEWREHAHDDLVLALAMALWYGELDAGTAASQAVLNDYLAAQFRRRR